MAVLSSCLQVSVQSVAVPEKQLDRGAVSGVCSQGTLQTCELVVSRNVSCDGKGASSVFGAGGVSDALCSWGFVRCQARGLTCVPASLFL